jgi:predicted PurR-regulated permease PerM
MRNPLIWVGLTLIVAIVIAFVTNPLVPLFNSVISLQTLALMLLVPFVIGLIIGYFLRMSQERRRPPVVKP